MGDFGGKLRQARERRGVSLRQVSAATKISVGVLEALERNDVSSFPAASSAAPSCARMQAKSGSIPTRPSATSFRSSRPKRRERPNHASDCRARSLASQRSEPTGCEARGGGAGSTDQALGRDCPGRKRVRKSAAHGHRRPASADGERPARARHPAAQSPRTGRGRQYRGVTTGSRDGAAAAGASGSRGHAAGSGDRRAGACAWRSGPGADSVRITGSADDRAPAGRTLLGFAHR